MDEEAQRQSDDYLNHRQEFQLHHLLTEQRHPKTWQLSAQVRADVARGLRALWAVDEDIVAMLARLPTDTGPLWQARQAILRAWRGGHRVFIYGCGSTGRLAKILEAGMWRRLWRRLDALGLSDAVLAGHPQLRQGVVGEITGADRAIISSLEGFEDLPLVGALQLQDHGIGAQDVVFAVSEGGETSSVLGALQAALQLQPTPRTAASDAHPGALYFVYNNPDALLSPLARCRAVLEEPSIARLMLATGPQALAGSTRMQATSSALFVLGALLEDALEVLLADCLEPAQQQALGLLLQPGLAAKLAGFVELLRGVQQQEAAVAALTAAEARAYGRRGRTLYAAQDALMTVFTDATERSPTFRLAPLDPVDPGPGQGRRSWLHVVAAAPAAAAAWTALLGRPFRGLDPERYAAALQAEVADGVLLAVAQASLGQATAAEAARYDLSPAGLARPGWALARDDLGIEVRFAGESAAAFAGLRAGAAPWAVCSLGPTAQAPTGPLDLHLQVADDPLGLRQHLALKLLLNAHSTAVMAARGRLVGNTMAFVQPTNLKLIGRATHLVQSHVNDLARPGTETLTYAAANRLVFAALAFRRGLGAAADAAPPETVLGIVQAILSQEAGRAIAWETALALAQAQELEQFLQQRRPGPAAAP